MKTLAGCLICLALSSIASGASEIPDAIIKRDGVFVYTDGSSYFAFHANGVFEAEPVFHVGRKIRGTWTKRENHFSRYVIRGNWAWVNAIRPDGGARTMEIDMHNAHDPEFLTPHFMDTVTNRPIKVYKVFAVIETLTKDETTNSNQPPVIRPKTGE